MRPQLKGSSFLRCRPTWREWLLAAIAAGAIALGVADRQLERNGRRRYHERYDTTNVVGKTKQQLLSRLGPPLSDGGSYWFYQEGQDPDAMIEFEGDRAVKVERFKN